jgi:two-component system, NarL family, sensor histidine kinase UhpB
VPKWDRDIQHPLARAVDRDGAAAAVEAGHPGKASGFHTEARSGQCVLPDLFGKNSRWHAWRSVAAAVRRTLSWISHIDPDSGALQRDMGIVVLVPVLAAGLFAQLELSEWLFSLTRRWEALQVDELPAALLLLTSCLAWFAWRRYREARAELGKRRSIEERLAALLSENRRLAQQYLRAQESQRKSLARELHDELGQYLNAIKTDAVSIQEKRSETSPAILRASSAIVRHTDHLHGVVRDLIRELRPVALDELGLKAALEHLLDHCRQRMPQVAVTVSFEGDLDTLAEPVNLSIYRLTQEGMTNVARHANATHVVIRVQRGAAVLEDAVFFSLSDNGRGADAGAPHGGLGLIGMRERVEMLGGQWRITTTPGQGFSIDARIPVGDREAQPPR